MSGSLDALLAAAGTNVTHSRFAVGAVMVAASGRIFAGRSVGNSSCPIASFALGALLPEAFALRRRRGADLPLLPLVETALSL